jgi:hypothetical protein
LNPSSHLLPICLLGALLILSSCGGRTRSPAYSPQENLLSIATELQLLTARDPYRDPPGRDLAGLSIARSTLVRAANYESLHPGRFTPEVLTIKARALELLGDFQSARRNYEEAAAYETELREDCRRRIAILDLFLVARALVAESGTPEDDARLLADQAAEFRRLATSYPIQPYQGLALREAEEAEVRRAELFIAGRWLFQNGEAQALEALEQLVSNHRNSARSFSHALRLARFHRQLAEEVVRLSPPDRLGFPEEKFKQHFDAAADLFYRISQADGFAERRTARHELDGLLAWGEHVQELLR